MQMYIISGTLCLVVLANFIQYGNTGKSLTMKALSESYSRISKGMSFLNISTACLKQIMSPSFKPHLVSYLDALGKPGSGIRLGHLYWPGSYEECNQIPDSHYCVGDVGFKIKQLPQLPMAFVGICAPIKCNADDVISLVEFGAKAFNLSKVIFIPKTGGLVSQYGRNIICPTKIKYGSGAIVTLVICGLLLLLCLIGTSVEVLQGIIREKNEGLKINKSEHFMPISSTSQEPSELSQDCGLDSDSNSVTSPLVLKEKKKISKGEKFLNVLLCFSLIKNTKNVMSCDVPSNAIGCLHGIRVLSIWWVILGHTQSLVSTVIASENSLSAAKVLERFTFLPIANGFFAVDTFFFLSGLLVAYLSMRRFNTYGKLPLLSFYVHRFVRLTPVYMFIILFFTNIFPLIGNGPVWSFIGTGKQIDACKETWWANVLYVNNFYPMGYAASCISWSWYLANDMQFYIISPIFLYSMYRFKIIGTMISTGIALMASFIVTGVLIGHYHLSPFITRDVAAQAQGNRVLNHYMDYVYIKPYCRIAPYLVGMVIGYVLHKKMRLGGTYKWVIASVGWALAVAFGMMIIYGTWPEFKPNNVEFGQGVNIAYGTFSRFIWGIALAWVVYACYFGLGGVINGLLSWSAFIPLSRLTYGVYLIHLVVLQLFFFGRQTPIHYTDMEMAIIYMAAVVSSYAAAFVVAVCVEIPFANLEKLVFKF